MAHRQHSLSPTLLRRARTAVAWAAGLTAVGLVAQNALPANSPFLPPNAPAAAANNGEPLEFAGVSTVGKRTDLIIYDKAAKKSRWIPLGDTVAGITAVKYDSRAETAVIRANGVEKNLTLRKGTGPINAPVPVNVPPAVATTTPLPPTSGQPVALPAAPAAAAATPPGAPAAPATPETIAKQEAEARMLVSDLLEIGMAQRKAYEEAHRKAAEANPADPTNATVPPVNPPPVNAAAPMGPAN
jgi:hypothetical protein